MNSELMLEKQKEDQVFMMKLYDWMTIHYMEHKLDVNEILTELEMNLADFEDNIKRITGMTPKEYIYDFRLSKARDLLVNTNDSLEDIARIIGFKTMGKFEMLFQHKTGKKKKKKSINFAPRIKNKGPSWFDRDTHQITLKTGLSSLVNGGPLSKHTSFMPVDYKDGEHPQPVIKEFSSHHPGGPILF